MHWPLLASASLDLQQLGSKQALYRLIPTSILKVQERYLEGKRSSYRKWGINVISSLLLLSHCLWKVRCNIVHAQSPGDFYGDEEETTHSLVRELLSTDLLSLLSDKHYILNFIFEEIITNRRD